MTMPLPFSDLLDAYGLWGLFLSAFLASTLLPGGSEAVVAGLGLAGPHPAWQLLTIATLGNTLGGMTSWALGFCLATAIASLVGGGLMTAMLFIR